MAQLLYNLAIRVVLWEGREKLCNSIRRSIYAITSGGKEVRQLPPYGAAVWKGKPVLQEGRGENEDVLLQTLNLSLADPAFLPIRLCQQLIQLLSCHLSPPVSPIYGTQLEVSMLPLGPRDLVWCHHLTPDRALRLGANSLAPISRRRP